MALASIGRGDFRPEEFDYDLTQTFDGQGGSAADYLFNLPALGELLGMGALASRAEFGADVWSQRHRSNGAPHQL